MTVPGTNGRSRMALIALLAAAVAVAAWLTPKVLRRLEMQGLRAVVVADQLDNPWALAFLPDGRLLVTERPGRMRLISPGRQVGAPLEGLPAVWAEGEGGLMDVVTAPDFERTGLLYWTYSEPGPDGTTASTAVARGRLVGSRVDEIEVIFRQMPKTSDGTHFGSRIVFGPDGLLYVGFGDRGARSYAQDLRFSHGKILRMKSDGSAPSDNPFVASDGALPQIWTLGHRNVQGLAFDGEGTLWASEHGPQGGDELNIIEPGHNYGWPTITYGTEYTTSAKIGEGTHKAGLDQPVAWWTPAIAPSGLVYLQSHRYPEWQGDLLSGMLQGRAVLRMKPRAHAIVEQQRLATGLLERVRDIRIGPDGWLYITTKSPRGRVIRLER